jgi:predicted kinase
LPEQRVLILTGLPGSGKSTWARAQGVEPLSSDELRRLLKDDATDQSIHRAVFQLIRHLLRRRLELGAKLSIVDATNILPVHRRPYIKIAQWFGAQPEAVFFDIPPETCHARNQNRSRKVPKEAIEAMAQKLIPPSFQEGFAKITVVSTTGEQTTTPPPESTAARP